jgi:PKD repeat protein
MFMRSGLLVITLIGISFLITGAAAMTANFSANHTSGAAPLAVRFTDKTTSSPTGWAWYFGDEDYTEAWTQVDAGASWQARSLHSIVVLKDGSILLMAGTNGTNVRLNDTWRSTDRGATWTEVNASSGWAGRSAPTSVVLKDGSIVLMGGYWLNEVGSKNDVWRSTDKGATWALVNASAGWSTRYGHTSVLLPDDSIVLLGGWHSDPMNDTWRSTDKGATWTLVNASSGWPVRNLHSSVVLKDGSILLMGGDDSVNVFNDTWRSTDKGATWTLVNAHAEWPARMGHSSVLMPDGSIVLMGGDDGTYTYLNDVWRSTDNGATWSGVNAGAGWSARRYPGCVLVPDGSILLTGGRGDSDPMNDTWRFMPAGSVARNPRHTYTKPGHYSVALQAYNAGGYTSTMKTGFITVLPPPPPSVTGITPNNGRRGNTVTVTNLTGSGFSATGAKIRLTKAGRTPIAATNVVVNAARNKITCRIPIGATKPIGLWNVKVINADGQSGILANAFTVKSVTAPTVTGIQPEYGTRGTTVTITNLSGTGFVGTDRPAVYLTRAGQTPIRATNVTVVSPSRITCKFPLAANKATGPWNVKVMNADRQSGTMANAFSVIAATLPTPTSTLFPADAARP